jgi:hypothetical protein
MWSAPSDNRNGFSVTTYLRYATVLRIEEVFSVWSVPRLYNEVSKYPRESVAGTT